MEKKIFTATGRRKSSTAQVRMVPGSGKITVNGKDVNDYMPFATLVMDLKQPLVITNNENDLATYEYRFTIPFLIIAMVLFLIDIAIRVLKFGKKSKAKGGKA